MEIEKTQGMVKWYATMVSFTINVTPKLCRLGDKVANENHFLCY